MVASVCKYSQAVLKFREGRHGETFVLKDYKKKGRNDVSFVQAQFIWSAYAISCGYREGATQAQGVFLISSKKLKWLLHYETSTSSEP